MSRIELKTITPIHIGNGNFLQNSAECAYYYKLCRSKKDGYVKRMFA